MNLELVLTIQMAPSSRQALFERLFIGGLISQGARCKHLPTANSYIDPMLILRYKGLVWFGFSMTGVRIDRPIDSHISTHKSTLSFLRLDNR
jgi:hypothetical protein